MTSKTEICNIALQKIGAGRIVDLLEEQQTGVKEAVECDLAYDHCRKILIRSHPWNCSTKRATLGPLAAAPDWEYTTQYELPADCLRVFHVNVPRGQRWVIEGNQLLTDTSDSVSILYGFDLDDATKFDSLFIEALATRIAYQIAESITQSNSKRDQMLREYQDLTLLMAMKVDAQEAGPEQIDDDDWLLARL